MLDRCKNLWKIEKKEEGEGEEELEEEVKDNVYSFNPFEDLLEDMDEEYENLYQTKTLNSIKRVASVPLKVITKHVKKPQESNQSQETDS